MVARRGGNFPGLAQRFWGNDLPGGLDLVDASARTVGQGGAAIVILGPDFEVLFTAGRYNAGNMFYPKPGNPPAASEDLRSGLARANGKGLLGGLKVPARCEPLMPLLRGAQLSTVLTSIRGLPDSGELGDFKKELTKRIEELRAKKRAVFDEYEKAGQKWEAFKAGSSYLRVFPQAEDAGEVRTKVGTLQRGAEVRKEMQAQQTFERLAPMLWGPKANPAAVKQSSQLLKQLATQFKGTEYGGIAEKLAE
jgi:hypothetical protein